MKKSFCLICLIICSLIVTTPAFAAAKDVIKVYFFNVDHGAYVEQSVTTVDLIHDGEVLSTDVPAFIDRGRTLVPIYIIGDLLDADVMWNQDIRRATIQTSDTTLVLTIGSDVAHVNGKRIELPDGVPAALVDYNGSARTMVPWRFVAEQLGAQVEWDPETYSVTLFFRTDAPPETEETPDTTTETDPTPNTPPQTEISPDTPVQPEEKPTSPPPEDSNSQDDSQTVETTLPQSKTVIVLDAGHGGSDPGAVYFGVSEKNVNFSVMQKVQALLLKQGYYVRLTRSDDSRVSLSERTEFANEIDADLFVSLHSNAADQAPTASGIETYYYSQDEAGKVLAGFIQESVIQATGAKNRKTKTANFYVCKNTEMPAVLVEMGFLTNEAECRNLTDESYQTKLAEGIVCGIINYLNSINKNGA